MAYTVKEFAEDDQPRERALKYGVESLATADLFALILRTGTPGVPVTDMCRRLMRANDDRLLYLERQTLHEICNVEGIGPAKALQVLAVMEIVRRYNRETLGERPRITAPDSVYKIMRHEIGNINHEEIWAIWLNRGNYVTGKYRLTSGGTTATVFDQKKLLKEALLSGADGVVLCHNHPSGNLRRSPQDDNITTRFNAACKQIELRFVDHVIVTADGFFSYSTETSLIG